MRKPHRFPDVIVTFLMVVGLAAIWIAWAPLQWGGEVSYVLVTGNSMEPGLHKGDLAIVRSAAAYQVGDIVTYHDAEMNVNVIHRIINQQDDHFILKGDNNSWVDAYHPEQGEIIGKLWVFLPQFGQVVKWVRSPVPMALTIGLLGGLFMFKIPQQKRTNQNKNKDMAAFYRMGQVEMGFYTSGVVVLVCLGLAIFAFSRQVLRQADMIKYQHTGVFSYTAAGIPGIYDHDSVSSGEPLFTKLTCSINLGFDYSVESTQPASISGVQQLIALVSDDQSGWQRTIPLTPATDFSGNAFSTRADIDLCQVQSLVSSFEQQTGIHLNTYTFAVIAKVASSGTLSGQEFQDTFEPRLVFKFDSTHFYLIKKSGETDPLKVIQPGALKSAALVDNSIAWLGMDLSVRNLRVISTSGLVLGLVGLGVVGWFYFRAARRSQANAIRLKYSHLLVNVAEGDLKSSAPMIDVASIEDLARMAERQNLNILHLEGWANHPAHSYFVQNNGATYRFVTSDTGGAGSS